MQKVIKYKLIVISFKRKTDIIEEEWQMKMKKS